MNRSIVDEIAADLLEYETLSGAKLDKMLGRVEQAVPRVVAGATPMAASNGKPFAKTRAPR